VWTRYYQSIKCGTHPRRHPLTADGEVNRTRPHPHVATPRAAQPPQQSPKCLPEAFYGQFYGLCSTISGISFASPPYRSAHCFAHGCSQGRGFTEMNGDAEPGRQKKIYRLLGWRPSPVCPAAPLCCCDPARALTPRPLLPRQEI